MWQKARALSEYTGMPLMTCMKALKLATFYNYNITACGVLRAWSLPGLHTYDDLVILSNGMPDPWEGEE